MHRRASLSGRVRTYKTRHFARFARRAGLSDAALCRLVTEIEGGLISAHLGGSLIKQRVARAGHGKSGGYRTLVAFRAGSRAIFVYGFAKNEQDNISSEELATLKSLADELLSYSDETMARLISDKRLTEVMCD